MDLILAHLGIEQQLVERRYRLAEDVVAEALELRTRNRDRTVLVVREAVHLDGGLCGRGEGALGLLARRPQTTHGARIVLHIRLCLLLELLDAVVDEDVVKVLTTEMSVARRRLHLKDTAVDREHTEVVSSAATIKDEHILLTSHLAAIKAIGDGRRRRLVDDTEHVEARDHARVLRGLALRIIEIRGHGNHRVLHLATKIRLRSRLHLLQNRRADLLGQKALRLALVVDLNLRLLALALEHLERPVLHVALDRGVAETATEQTLCIEDSVRGV